ncbi:hypothetical protein ACRRTK_023283 [Alexandromys fortis]
MCCISSGTRGIGNPLYPPSCFTLKMDGHFPLQRDSGTQLGSFSVSVEVLCVHFPA